MAAQSAYLSVRQTADLLALSQRTVRRYIEQEILPAYRVTGSNTIRIKREDLETLLQPITPKAQNAQNRRCSL